MENQNSLPFLSPSEACQLKGNLSTLLYSTKMELETRLQLMDQIFRQVFPPNSESLTTFAQIEKDLKSGEAGKEPFSIPLKFLWTPQGRELKRIVKKANQLIDFCVKEIPDSELESRIQRTIYGQMLRSWFVRVAAVALLIAASALGVTVWRYDNKFSKMLNDVNEKGQQLNKSIQTFELNLSKRETNLNKEVNLFISKISDKQINFAKALNNAERDIDARKEKAVEEVLAALDQRTSSLREALDDYEARALKLGNSLETAEKSVSPLLSKTVDLSNSLDLRNEEINKLAEDLSKFSAKLEAFETTRKEFVNVLTSGLKDDIDRTTEKLEEARSLVSSIEALELQAEASVHETQSHESSAQRTREALVNSETRITKATEQFLSNLPDLEKEAIKSVVQDLNRQVEEIRGQLTEVANTLQELRKHLKTTSSSLANLESDTETQQQLVVELETRLRDARSATDQTIGSLSTLLEEAQVAIAESQGKVSEAASNASEELERADELIGSVDKVREDLLQARGDADSELRRIQALRDSAQGIHDNFEMSIQNLVQTISRLIVAQHSAEVSATKAEAAAQRVNKILNELNPKQETDTTREPKITQNTQN